MSSALAIASVTQVLKDLLNNGLSSGEADGLIGSHVSVTASTPDKIDTASASEPPQLNLFMYHISYNQGWRNERLPSVDSRGDRITYPILAVDLHYLLTAYGSGDLVPEMVMGFGMQVLHENPVLTRATIQLSKKALSNSNDLLETSSLADQIEQIKISPEALSIDEIYKLWPAFQAKYRLTMAYRATVVLIESNKPAMKALPVKERNIYAITIRKPVIDEIRSQKAIGEPILADQTILSGDNIVIMGDNLKVENVKLFIDDKEEKLEDDNISDKQIIARIPVSLKAGIHRILLGYTIKMGTPPEDHQAVTSNVKSFALCTEIVSAVPGNIDVADNGLRSATISISVKPDIGETQRLTLLLNEVNNGITQPNAYSFNIPTLKASNLPAPASALNANINEVKKGSYLLRLLVDGAESPLQMDSAGKYTLPNVTLS